MTTAQVILSESESQAIQALSQSRGKTQEEILHEAIEQFLTQHQVESRLAALRQARGIWQERQDLLDFAELRDEWNRF
ncbi:MAG: CopG family transcriptional regulator [Candidatus Competibacteraceae bacterium]|nr:CopG family transcriptional regulator [Candidatus Competibacteraceae bacterium]